MAQQGALIAASRGGRVAPAGGPRFLDRAPRSRRVRTARPPGRRRASRGHGGRAGGVLVLLDADDDCPAALGPALLERARAARSDVPISVVLANREFEAWFIAAAESLAGTHGFPADLTPPLTPRRSGEPKNGWDSARRIIGLISRLSTRLLWPPPLTWKQRGSARRHSTSSAATHAPCSPLATRLDPPSDLPARAWRGVAWPLASASWAAWGSPGCSTNCRIPSLCAAAGSGDRHTACGSGSAS